MINRTEYLRTRANYYLQVLSKHIIFSKYWNELSVILKGSIARGITDKYSDVDFVLFCNAAKIVKIVSEFKNEGLTERDDNIFLPLEENGHWEGHYNLESYEHLAEYYTVPNIPQAWEYSNVIILHDPNDTYKNIVGESKEKLVSRMFDLTKDRYLKLQLTLNWLSNPLKRGDSVSVFLHCSDLIRGICQMCYLLDDKFYPHDKWIYHYLDTTEYGSVNNQLILDYIKNVKSCDEIIKDKETDEYSQYAKAENLINKIGELIENKYGYQRWIREWGLFV